MAVDDATGRRRAAARVQAAVSWHLNDQEFESVISLPAGTVGVLLVRTLMLRHHDVPLHFLTLLSGSVSNTPVGT
jgi:hypothetical protein